MEKRVRMIAVVFAVALLAACAPTQPPMPPGPSAQDHFNWGLNAFRMGQFDNAISEFQQALAMDPGFADAYFYLGQTYEKKNMTADAERAYMDAIRANARHLKSREALGILLYKSGRAGAAKEQLEQARALFSIMPEVYFYLGEIYRAENRCLDALAAYERALQLNSSYVEARNALDVTKKTCRQPGTAGQAPVKVEKSFTGGGKAIDPGKF